jgi:hypothetical protein
MADISREIGTLNIFEPGESKSKGDANHVQQQKKSLEYSENNQM